MLTIASLLPYNNSVLTDIVNAIEDRSARGIAAALGRMITSGAAPTGTRLPTVRALSRSLGVSPTTVSEAWQTLAAVGAIDSRGRLGTFVSQPVGPGGQLRYRRVTEGPGRFALDLSTGTPDPDLLPDLPRVIAMVSGQSLTSSYLDQPVLPALEEALLASWPFVPQQITVVDGAMDALDRVAQIVVRLGDRVVVEHPTFPPLLDLLELIGAEVIGVGLDDEGISVEGLAAALLTQPSAVFLQPRAHNPTGITMSARRCVAISALLASSAAIIIEDDHSGDIASGKLVSVGTTLPEQTVHIRSFSKSHGPDLRLAAIGGAGHIVSAVANRRLIGPGWSSRILQAVLVTMLGDPTTINQLALARDEYARRRELVTRVLDGRLIPYTGTDGINLWMRVNHERSALITLAAQGVGAAPGEPFMVRPTNDHSLRLTVGLLNGPTAEIAATAHRLADVAGFTATRSGQR